MANAKKFKQVPVPIDIAQQMAHIKVGTGREIYQQISDAWDFYKKSQGQQAIPSTSPDPVSSHPQPAGKLTAIDSLECRTHLQVIYSSGNTMAIESTRAVLEALATAVLNDRNRKLLKRSEKIAAGVQAGVREATDTLGPAKSKKADSDKQKRA